MVIVCLFWAVFGFFSFRLGIGHEQGGIHHFAKEIPGQIGENRGAGFDGGEAFAGGLGAGSKDAPEFVETVDAIFGLLGGVGARCAVAHEKSPITCLGQHQLPGHLSNGPHAMFGMGRGQVVEIFL